MTRKVAMAPPAPKYWTAMKKAGRYARMRMTASHHFSESKNVGSCGTCCDMRCAA
jgi:hypothetical protein